MKELFTVGEIGRLFDMNIRTLRYYDEIGLLHPEHVDEKTGYRYYSTKQFERLNTIKYLRAMDMPLERIIRFFENKDTATLMGLLKEQQEETKVLKARLETIERKLERRILQLSDAMDSQLDEIKVTYIPDRKIAFLRKEIPLDEDLEYPIRELEKKNHLKPMMFLGKVGVSIALENILVGEFSRFSGIFVFLEKEDEFQCQEVSLAGGNYVTIRYSGTHREAEHSYKKLLDYIDGHGYSCCGDSVEITLIDSGFTSDSDKYITELQLPVQISCLKYAGST
ncbi:MerR family transcriptional regulator [Clostridium sp. AM58-1XD]|uniref:MerR family transcriptional regulator n=1 Tax=Clostridium sp. AM58-1XD TaxID=2292307 RepID=UPI000E520AE5|nr:MerR family transcriptional regulator [Clostridium sp. AM58-1XD]RGY99845.1 MerR family transcriptional regulator [Clostridium sp. AM58-1XD]